MTRELSAMQAKEDGHKHDIFHSFFITLSLRYACIRSLGIILIPQAIFVPNFISFAPSIAELAHK